MIKRKRDVVFDILLKAGYTFTVFLLMYIVYSFVY